MVQVSGSVVKSLPLTEVVNRRPGVSRPGIVKLPIKRAHRIVHMPTSRLYSYGNSISLHDHALIHVAFKVLDWGFEIKDHVLLSDGDP